MDRKKMTISMRLKMLGIFTAGIIGCDSPTTPAARPHIGPHHTALLALPDNAGFAEVVNEPEVTDRRANLATAIAVYFLQADEKSALGTVPTDVRVRLGKGRQQAETVALKSEPKAEDAAGGCRFVSKIGPYLLEDNHATLVGKLNGKAFELDLSGGR